MNADFAEAWKGYPETKIKQVRMLKAAPGAAGAV